MLRSLANRLARGQAAVGAGREAHRPSRPDPRFLPPFRREEARPIQLDVPVADPGGPGYDAVGLPARYASRLIGRTGGSGCVFADDGWWWWIVPAGSDHGLRWPLPSHYAPGARIPGRRPRLISGADGRSPYTPPIPLYLMTCQLTGSEPHWPVAAPGLRQ
ncbi:MULTISPECIES: hypothetical protein [unclassified Streptomyces]|uniref:hypothetical protein n=1 Tax=unclassified Streptomyces TaxID=2593676 RepID=UPI00381A7D5B